MKRSKVNRRNFLQKGMLGIIGLGAAGTAGAACTRAQEDDPELDFEMEGEDAPQIARYNTLGNTGLKVSDICLGMAREPSVLHYAFDRGINFFDTAESYYEGEHERHIGKAFKKLRDKIVVITKHHFANPQTIKKKEVIERFDQSLKRLGFNSVDVAMLHQIDNPELLKCDELLSAYEDLKKAGKYRFLGFSTHQAERICPPAFESGLFSAMMVIYNSVQYPERSENITRAKKLGIGVIAMKTMMGREQDKLAEMASERTTYSQAAIKWALTDDAVTSAVLSMRTFEHIDEYLQASGKKLAMSENEVIRKYVKAADNRYCRVGCETCQAACPNEVKIGDVMRFGMYFDNYGEEKHAIREYARLDERHRAAPCRTCHGQCESACPHQLAIRERLIRYDGLLRV